MRRSVSVAAIGSALALTMGTGVATASGAVFDGTNEAGSIRACFSINSGALRVIDTKSGASCRKDERAISWSAATAEPVTKAENPGPVSAPEYVGARGAFTPIVSVQVTIPDGQDQFVEGQWHGLQRRAAGQPNARCEDYMSTGAYGLQLRVAGEQHGHNSEYRPIPGTIDEDGYSSLAYAITGSFTAFLAPGTHTVEVGYLSMGCSTVVLQDVQHEASNVFLTVEPETAFPR